MNISIIQIKKCLAFPAPIHGKWYAVVFKDHCGKRLAAYLSPDGWQPIAFYFDSKEDANQVSLKYGLPPDDWNGWDNILKTYCQIESMHVRDDEDDFYSFERQALTEY